MPLVVEIKCGGEYPSYVYQLHAQRQLAEELNGCVTLDPVKHIYKTWDGIEHPGITSILDLISDFDDIPEKYAKRGQYIHEATALIDGVKPGHKLKWKTAKYKPYLTAWRKFKKDYHLENQQVIIETPLISRYGYAGTLDRDYPEMFPGRWVLWAVYLKPSGKYVKKPYLYEKAKFNDFLSCLAVWKLRNKLGVK